MTAPSILYPHVNCEELREECERGRRGNLLSFNLQAEIATPP